MEHRNNATLLDLYNWQKFNKVNGKSSYGYQSMDPEYVTGKLIVVFWRFFLDDFFA